MKRQTSNLTLLFHVSLFTFANEQKHSSPHRKKHFERQSKWRKVITPNLFYLTANYKDEESKTC